MRKHALYARISEGDVDPERQLEVKGESPESGDGSTGDHDSLPSLMEAGARLVLDVMDALMVFCYDSLGHSPEELKQMRAELRDWVVTRALDHDFLEA